MIKLQKFSYFTILTVILALFSTEILAQNRNRNRDNDRRGSRNTLNRNITINADTEINGALRSINGTIDVGEGCSVEDINTVNGTIRIRMDVIIRGDVGSVNGRVNIQDKVRIDGNVTSVNGRITLDREVVVRDNVEIVNGSINLDKATVEQDITTYNGNITLRNSSRVKGNIVVEENRGWSNNRRQRRHLTIDLSRESVVEGDIIIEDDDIEVTVYISGGAKVEGKIDSKAEVIRR